MGYGVNAHRVQDISLLATIEQASTILIMTRNVSSAVLETTKWLPPLMPKIALTLAGPESDGKQQPITISVSELIAYFAHTGHTRLLLAGRKNLQVKETTAQIDRLVRDASSQPCP